MLNAANPASRRLSEMNFHPQDEQLFTELEKTKAILRNGIDLSRIKSSTEQDIPRLVLFGCSHNNAMRGASLRQIKALSLNPISSLTATQKTTLATLEKTLKFFDHQTSRYAMAAKGIRATSPLTPATVAAVIQRLNTLEQANSASTDRSVSDNVAKYVGNLLYTLSNPETGQNVAEGTLSDADYSGMIDACFDQMSAERKHFVFDHAAQGKASAKAVNQLLVETTGQDLFLTALSELNKLGAERLNGDTASEETYNRVISKIEKSLVNATLDFKNKVYLTKFDLSDLMSYGQICNYVDGKGDLSAFNLFTPDQLELAANASDSIFARAAASTAEQAPMVVDEDKFSEALRQLNHRAQSHVRELGSIQPPNLQGAETLLHKTCRALQGHPPAVVAKILPLIKAVAANTTNINMISGAGASPLHELLEGLEGTLYSCDPATNDARDETEREIFKACEDVISFFIEKGANWQQKTQVFSLVRGADALGLSAKEILQGYSPTLYAHFFDAKAA